MWIEGLIFSRWGSQLGLWSFKKKKKKSPGKSPGATNVGLIVWAPRSPGFFLTERFRPLVSLKFLFFLMKL